MKNLRYIIVVIIVLLLATSCGTDNSPIFSSELKMKNNVQIISYTPATKFKEISADSVRFYGSRADLALIMSAETFMGETIYSDDYFMIKTMMRSFPRNNQVKHQVLLRTFKNDLRLLDDIVISSTVDSIPFSGKLNSDLSYEIVYENGERKTGHINEKGRFTNVTNE